MSHNCPVCRIALTDKMYDTVSLAECLQCAGIWILIETLKTLESGDPREMECLDAEVTPVKAVPPTTALRPCPSCELAMARFHIMFDPPVLLYRCDTCDGLWIDHGELTQMAAAIEQIHQPVGTFPAHPAGGPDKTLQICAANQPERTMQISPLSQPEKTMEISPAARTVATLPPLSPMESKAIAEAQLDGETIRTTARYQMINSVLGALSTRIWYI